MWIWLLLVGCSAAEPPAPVAPAPAQPESAMTTTVSVSSPADFAEATRVFMELLYSGSPATLTVELAAGTYDSGVLSLVDDMSEGEVALVVRGNGAHFSGATMALAGPEVRVEGVVFSGRKVPLTVAARRSAHLSRLAVVELAQEVGRGGTRTRTGAIRVEAQEPGVSVHIEDLWLAGVRAPGGQLVLGGQPRGSFAQVRIERVIATPGEGAVISGLVPAAVELREAVAVLGLGQALFAPSSPKATLAVRDSHLFAPRAADLVLPATSPTQIAVEFLPVSGEGSTVYATAAGEAQVELLPSNEAEWDGKIADPGALVAGASEARAVDVAAALRAVRGT